MYKLPLESRKSPPGKPTPTCNAGTLFGTPPATVVITCCARVACARESRIVIDEIADVYVLRMALISILGAASVQSSPLFPQRPQPERASPGAAARLCSKVRILVSPS